MSTILRRPLFRKGGQAGGITTGLGRERHANGDVAGKVRNYLNLGSDIHIGASNGPTPP